MTRLTRFWIDNRLMIVIVAALAVGFLVLRTTPTAIADAGEFTAALQQGQPTVVEFYSNF